MKYSLSLSNSPDETLRQAIVDPLAAYNACKAGPSNHRVLSISLHDGDTNCVGGLYGRTDYSWLFIELIFVPESMRGQGIGRELMEMAEQEAVARNCHGAWLDTFEFQARAFYEKLGYKVFGELPHFPDSFSRYFMRKILTSWNVTTL
jgi:GNAT superfamily N-acetyltransferase